MSNFIFPRTRLVDNNGAPLAGGLIYFYEAGSSTPKNVYSDAELGNAHANPLEADADGWVPRFFAAEDEQYKVVITDEDDAVFWEEDDVSPAQLVGTSTEDRIAQIASSPLDHGAVGDGSTNDATALAAAITAATGTIDLLGKTYRCDSGLTLTAGLTLKNGTLDFSQAASPPSNMLAVQGTHGTATALTANAVAGATAVVLTSVSGMAENDWLYVKSTSPFGVDPRGEAVQIDGISGLTVTLKTPLRVGYYTVDTATAQRMATVKNVTIDNVRVITNPVGSGTGNVILVDVAETFRATGVRIDGAKNAGFNIQASVGVRIEDCYVDGDASGYGLIVSDHSRDVVVDKCTIRRTSDGIAIAINQNTGGITQDVTIRDCRIDKYSGYAIEVVKEAIGIAIERALCSAHSSTGGIAVDAVAVSIEDCSVRGGTPSITVEAYHDGTNSLAPYTWRVSNCKTYSGDITVTMTDDIGELFILNNRVYGANMTISSNSSDTVIGFNRVGGLMDVTANAGSVRIFGNDIEASGVCLTYSGGSRSVISGNTLAGTGARAASITNADGLVFTGNYCSRSNDAASCVLFTNCDTMVINGNTVNNGTYGFEFVTSTDIDLGTNAFVGQATGETTGSGVNSFSRTSSGSDPAIAGTNSSTGAGVHGTGTSGYGLIAESDTSSPAKAALRVVPQDADPSSSPAAGDIYVSTTSGLPSIRKAGSEWARGVAKVKASVATTDTRTSSGAFAQTHVIPANTLQIGSVIRIMASGQITAYTSGTMQLEIDTTGSLIAQTISMTPNGDENFSFHCWAVVRAIGASGDVTAGGIATISRVGLVGSGGTTANNNVDTSVDTTSAVTISVSVALSGTATVRLDTLIVDISD